MLDRFSVEVEVNYRTDGLADIARMKWLQSATQVLSQASSLRKVVAAVPRGRCECCFLQFVQSHITTPYARYLVLMHLSLTATWQVAKTSSVVPSCPRDQYYVLRTPFIFISANQQLSSFLIFLCSSVLAIGSHSATSRQIREISQCRDLESSLISFSRFKRCFLSNSDDARSHNSDYRLSSHWTQPRDETRSGKVLEKAYQRGGIAVNIRSGRI